MIMRSLSKEFIAGFFEGEGSITITKPCRSSPTHSLFVNLGNTNRDILEKIQKIYGGYIATDRRQDTRHSKIYYQLTFKERVAEYFLLEILPFLTIKKAQAEVALEFRNTKKIHRNRFNPLTQEIIEKREELRLKLVSLR